MTKYLILSFLLLTLSVRAQEVSGNELLTKSIAYHDPNNTWENANISFRLQQARPSGEQSEVYLELRNAESAFMQTQVINESEVQRYIRADTCHFLVDKSPEVSEDQIKTFKLDCDRAKSMRNYYVYLYGLPMKLRDPGTIIDPVTKQVVFQGKEYLQLKVTYAEEVGRDTWYFYFDPNSFAMEGYRFYHDESKNDGEYITLKGVTEVMDMKLPKFRAWYVNKDDEFLGSDDLVKAEVLR